MHVAVGERRIEVEIGDGAVRANVARAERHIPGVAVRKPHPLVFGADIDSERILPLLRVEQSAAVGE